MNSTTLNDFEIMAPVGSRESCRSYPGGCGFYLLRYRKPEYACPFRQYLYH